MTVPDDGVRGVLWLANYLKDKLQSDPALRTISIRGEVSNFKVSARGHLNFDLSEEGALLRCFAWQDDFLMFPEFKNGTKIVASGAIATYALRSSYQLVVRKVRPEGAGDVHQQFEERRRRLAAEGAFDPARKRSLPKFPFRVALVSSRRAEGATDFVTRMHALRPHVSIVWCETSVQGPNAPNEIVGALGRASMLDVDLIVLARGGGSFEDLFAFSDENVVRAVVKARHPVLSAVGHTVNQQLSDFAADLHAETPSAAAERVGPETRALSERVDERMRRIGTTVRHGIERLSNGLARALTRSKLDDAKLFLLPQQQRIDSAAERLQDTVVARFRARAERLSTQAERLRRFDPTLRLAKRGESLRVAVVRLGRAIEGRFGRAGQRLALASVGLDGNNPEAILQKGYAIVTHLGRIVRDPTSVPVGGMVEARVAHGTLSAIVEATTVNGNERSG